MKITLCGSARFENHFKLWNEVLSLAGHTVYSLAVYPSDKAGQKSWYTEEEKIILDKVHKDKIKASNAILVLNVFGYVGESTLSEINFAIEKQKDIYALESWGKGFGIGASHYDSIQKLCYEMIPEYQGSPIDSTSRAGFKYPYDLLGSAGPARSRLVTMISEREVALGYRI